MMNYICRRCDAKRTATWKETQSCFCRVVCYQCGGTCDPTPEENRRILTIRERARQQRLQVIRNQFGYGEKE